MPNSLPYAFIAGWNSCEYIRVATVKIISLVSICIFGNVLHEKPHAIVHHLFFNDVTKFLFAEFYWSSHHVMYTYTVEMS